MALVTRGLPPLNAIPCITPSTTTPFWFGHVSLTWVFLPFPSFIPNTFFSFMTQTNRRGRTRTSGDNDGPGSSHKSLYGSTKCCQMRVESRTLSRISTVPSWTFAKTSAHAMHKNRTWTSPRHGQAWQRHVLSPLSCLHLKKWKQLTSPLTMKCPLGALLSFSRSDPKSGKKRKDSLGQQLHRVCAAHQAWQPHGWVCACVCFVHTPCDRGPCVNGNLGSR